MSAGYGPPAVNTFGMITGIGDAFSKSYDGAKKDALTRDLGERVKAGDYAGAADAALKAGDLQTGLALVKLGESRGASEKLATTLGGLFGGGSDTGSDSGSQAGGTLGTLSQSYRDGGPKTPSFASTGGAMGDYLGTVRGVESGNNPTARNPNSTATGLDQFTQGTWNGLAKKYPELGLTPNGRTDPEQSTRAMEAFTRDNANALSKAGIPITPGNLYVSHFLGEAGGPRFIAGAMSNPDAPATQFVTPGAVSANRSIFLNRDGSPKTAGQVYAERTGRFGGGSDQVPTLPTQTASNGPMMTMPALSGGGASTVAQAEPDAANMPSAGAVPAEFFIPPGSGQGAPVLGRPAPHNVAAPGTPSTAAPGDTGGDAAPAANPQSLVGRMPVNVQLAGAGVPRQAAVAIGRTTPGSPERLNALLQASLIPGLSEQQQGVVKALFSNELEQSKAPDAVKQYLFARSPQGGGFEGSFADFQNKKGDEGAKIQAQLKAREDWLVAHGMDPKEAGNQAWIMGGKTSSGHVLKPGDILAGPSGQTLARNASAASSLPDQTADFLAERVLAGDTRALIGLGRGAQGAENLAKIQGLVAQKAAERGQDATDLLYNSAKAAGLNAEQRSLGTSSGRMAAASVEAEGAIKLGLEASAAVPRSSFVPLNRAIQMVQSNTGDPALKQFVAANNTIVNTFARAISPSGSPTVSDKEHAREMLSTADSHEAYVAVLQQMQKEIDMAHKASQQARTVLEQERQNAKRGGGEAGQSDGADAAGGQNDGQARKLPEVVKGGRPPDGYSWDGYLAGAREKLRQRPDLRPQIEERLAKAGIDPRKLGK